MLFNILQVIHILHSSDRTVIKGAKDHLKHAASINSILKNYIYIYTGKLQKKFSRKISGSILQSKDAK